METEEFLINSKIRQEISCSMYISNGHVKICNTMIFNKKKHKKFGTFATDLLIFIKTTKLNSYFSKYTFTV